MNALEQAAIVAAEIGGAPPKTFRAGPNADSATGCTPFDHLQLTGWVDSCDVMTGRCE